MVEAEAIAHPDVGGGFDDGFHETRMAASSVPVGVFGQFYRTEPSVPRALRSIAQPLRLPGWARQGHVCMRVVVCACSSRRGKYNVKVVPTPSVLSTEM